jgi:tetratricopeptide (TPR) repeat protein
VIRLTLALVPLLATRPASAQMPERFTNLQVLPRDIPRKELSLTMRSWASALGVRCGHCHVGGNPDTLEGVDFASDAKWEKRTAREMLRMVQAIGASYLRKIESRPASAGSAALSPVSVSCITCHHGLARPETLDAVLDRVLRADGVEAAAQRYRELRAEYLTRGSYDFSERSVNTLAERLMEQKKHREAAVLLETSADFNQDAAWLQHLLGEARLALGDKAKALAAFSRALALNPHNDWTRKRLEEVQKAAEPVR